MPQLRFRYRYVPFGTNFQGVQGVRTDANTSPSHLYDNELAVDVGGVCWGLEGEERSIIDHHFVQPARYPSATAGVLHLAEKIWQRFGDRADGSDLWLVTHQQPDFDALCSMYLARSVLNGHLPPSGWGELGLRPDGWHRANGEIDWLRPEVGSWSVERRWPVLLGAYASHVDNCLPLVCPRNRTLHSVLYAALLRGRPYLTEESGAVPFFDEVRLALSDAQRGLNPLFDSVLESSEAFAPELAFLDTQLEAYRHDIGRGRRSIVFLQQATVPFGKWYPQLANTPLLTSGSNGATIQPAHLAPPGHIRQQADGIFLRDPQCLLFKEWARDDLENSSLGNGFVFTGVAYSNGRPQATGNQTEYFFSLDPERAAGRHLYSVWARLQVVEAKAFDGAPSDGKGGPALPRSGFEGRAGEKPAKAFQDPWFDGNNYQVTIVATPGRGTAIGPAGIAADLSDDPVASVVQEELELRVFTDEFTVHDLLPLAAHHVDRPVKVSVSETMQSKVPRPPEGSWRFARIELSEGVDLTESVVAEQIGRLLWRVIDADAGSSVPDDFLQRHLIRKANWIGVWSRQGIVIATKSQARDVTDRIQELFTRLSRLAGSIESLSRRNPDQASILSEGDSLVRQVAQIRYELALPQNQLVRQFFEASRLDELLRTVRDLNAAVQQQQIAEKMDKNLTHMVIVQKAVHLIERVITVYYFIQIWEHVVGTTSGYEHWREGVNEWFAEHLPAFTFFRWDFIVPVIIALVLVHYVNRFIKTHESTANTPLEHPGPE